MYLVDIILILNDKITNITLQKSNKLFSLIINQIKLLPHKNFVKKLNLLL